MSEVIYVLDTFEASQQGQITVLKNDQLLLLNDDHYYWWYVQELKTNSMGFVPAELLEFPNERLARHNSLRNQRVQVAGGEPKVRPNRQRSVRFTPSINDVPDLSSDHSSSESDLLLAGETATTEVVLPAEVPTLASPPKSSLENTYDAVPGMAANLEKMNDLERRLRSLINGTS